MAATLQWIVIPKPAPGATTTAVTLAIAEATTIVTVVDNLDGTVTVYFV